MVVVNQNVIIYIMLLFVSVQRTSQTSFRIFLQTSNGAVPNSTVMIVAAIFKSRLLKMGTARKIHLSS